MRSVPTISSVDSDGSINLTPAPLIQTQVPFVDPGHQDRNTTEAELSNATGRAQTTNLDKLQVSNCPRLFLVDFGLMNWPSEPVPGRSKILGN